MNRSTDARRARALLLFVGVLLAGVSLTAVVGCGGGRTSRWGAGDDGPLQAWVAVHPDSAGVLAPVVEARVPYRALVFSRRDGVFASRLQVVVTAWRDGRQVGGGVGVAMARVAGADAARAERALDVTVPLQLRGDEDARLEVVANVPGTVRSWRRELALAPRTLRAAPLLVADTRAGVGATADTLLLDADTARLTLDVGLVRPAAASWPAGGVALRVEAVAGGDRHATLRRLRIDAAPAAADTSWRELDLPTAALPFGRSVLRVVLQWQRDGEDLHLPHQPGLPVVNLRVPFADDEGWSRHVAWLDGVASEARRDSLLATAAPARASGWDALWADVASGAGRSSAEELSRRHLRRIVAADARFGGFGRGALSDRGRVYVRRGPPDEVETVADAHLPGAVWEIWTYRRSGLRFFFHDAHGMGDFRLRRREPHTG